MIRSMGALAAGYFSITILNSFVHLIISIYFKTGVTLTGISFLPSLGWVIGVTVLQFFFGLFGGLLATTIAKHPTRVILGLILLMVAIALMNYTVNVDNEPLWYLIVEPILVIGGIYSGNRIQTSN